MAASPLAAALLSGEGGAGNAASFLDPNIAQAMPDLQLGQALTQGGLSSAPASPWQALARIAQAGAGQYLQRSAISDLAKAYAHTADNMAQIFPEGTPVGNMLRSSDPTVRMMGLQQAGKAAIIGQEGYDLSPGAKRFQGPVPVAENTNAVSEPGKVQQDINNAARRAPLAIAPAVPGGGAAPAAGAGVPLNPPRFGGMSSVVGMGPGGPGTPSATAPQAVAPVPSAGVPTTAPNFNDRFAAASPKPTSVPSNPLQGAIDLEAKQAGAKKAAEDTAAAGVKFGDLLSPQGEPRKGPGGTEALTTTHGTLVPPLTEQAPLPKSPAEAEAKVGAWQKTQEGWQAGLQPGYQAEQRLQTIANVFKTMQTGWGAEQKAQASAMLKSIGINLPESVLGDPAKTQLAIHENYVETLQQLKASTPRFTQMEFKALSQNKEHPDLQPEANLQMLSEDIGQLRQARDLPRDFVTAQQHGWRDPQSFEQAWLRQNPLKGYVDSVRKEIGPLKGMPGNEAGAKSEFPGGAPQTPQAPKIASKAEYDALPKGSPYTAPDGSIRTKK